MGWPTGVVHATCCRPNPADAPAGEQGAAQRDEQRQAMHAKKRCEAGQGAGRRLRVTDGEQREAGENPAFQPVDRSNQRGEEQGLPPECRRLPALEDIARSHWKQRHDGAEQESGGPGHPPRHAAEDGEADVHPRHAGEEKSHAEGQPGEQALTGVVGLAQQHEQAKPDQRRQPEQAEGGEATDADDTDGRSDQIACCP